ncbi:ubiquitin carboxyl-terminal hydrolase [Botryosphaeria dothidea]|uniref:Ubiquitin carboxyl-terminal hydrolase n=1 Tax=Botryosphaeria dothidea TaxID=55169 RepID=A0A8H4J2P9_9PEZI|nr:ubiquitin carboxyl-terminal hydrolase [Botryosphaeria dothidea]
MTSFFGRLRSNAPPASPSTAIAPAKKDPNALQSTPLEKLLAADTGPIRADGSDKFFGFENFGSTCYCNSIIQCLYYSTPFREQVINFPIRSPQDSLVDRISGGLPRLNTDLSNAGADGQKNPLSPTKQPSSAQLASPKKSGAAPGAPGGPPGTKPEENKDSPEYKKKQAMAAGPVLNMDYENSKAYGMPESLFTSLKDIFEAIIAHRSRVGVVSPQKFLEILRRENEMFRSAMHQDAHEFLNLLLNEVVENVEQFSRQQQQQQLEQQESAEQSGESDSGLAVALSPVLNNAVKNAVSNNTGWVHSLWEGTLTSETRCLTCENVSQRDEAFLDLSVDLEQNSSVTSCLKRFSEEEMLCERNKFHCDNCGGLQEAEKRMKVKRLPRILALHLKRFKYTEDMQRLQKLFHRVVYPYYLRLFNTTDDAEDPDRLYELYAVVVHIGGGAYHGHYVSIIKTEDRGWLLFDDEMVEPVDKAYVRNFFGGENVLACAYVLFYQETTEEAMRKEQESEGLNAADTTVSVPLESVTSPVKPEEAPVNGHVFSPVTPVEEEKDQFVNLDHAASAPPLSQSPPPRPASQPPLEHFTTTPSQPTLKTKWSESFRLNHRDKEKLREEKERRASIKAAEKEQEKLAKAQRKEEESKLKEAAAKRREIYKKQEDEMRAVLAASKATAKEEEKHRRGSTAQHVTSPHTPNVVNGEKDESDAGVPPNTASTTAPSSTGSEPPTGKPSKENGHHRHIHGSKSISGGLNRFRHSSISLRHKPKFLSGSGKDHTLNLDEAPPTPTLPPQFVNEPHTPTMETPLAPTFASPKWNPATPDRAVGSSDISEGKELPPVPPPKEGKKEEKKEKGYSKFSLGRKKSSMLGFG